MAYFNSQSYSLEPSLITILQTGNIKIQIEIFRFINAQSCCMYDTYKNTSVSMAAKRTSVSMIEQPVFLRRDPDNYSSVILGKFAKSLVR